MRTISMIAACGLVMAGAVPAKSWCLIGTSPECRWMSSCKGDGMSGRVCGCIWEKMSEAFPSGDHSRLSDFMVEKDLNRRNVMRQEFGPEFNERHMMGRGNAGMACR